MFQAYTYYLYHVPTGKKYYGSRAANKCEPEMDLWNEYFSSSDLVESLIKEYGKDSFVAEVRKKFDVAQDARDWEDRVLRKLKVVEKDDWLNQAYTFGPYHADNTGRVHGDREKEKQSKSMLEHWETRPEKRLAYSERTSGEKNPMFGVHRFGESAPNFGRKQSDAQRKATAERMKLQMLGNKRALGSKQSEKRKDEEREHTTQRWQIKLADPNYVHHSAGRKWIHNIVTLKRRVIKADESLPDGWAFGGKPKKS